MSKPDFVAVVSIERTATQSVYKSLLDARVAPIVRHVHYLDTARMRGPLPVQPEKRRVKEQQEEQVRRFVSAPTLKRAVFTVLRDELDRVQSCVWYDRVGLFASLYDREEGTFSPEADDWIDTYVQRFATWGREYGGHNFTAMGLPADLKPGQHTAPDGLRVYALDFAHLERDFSAATKDLLGEAAPLAKINSGASYGDPLVYAAFRKRFDERWPREHFEACSLTGDFRSASRLRTADEEAAAATRSKAEHFDGVWGKVSAVVDELKAEGETSMPRVLRMTEAKWRTMNLTPTEGAVNGARVTMPRASLVGARQQLLMRTLVMHTRLKTSLVVELGSGWGQNLIDLYLSGGPRRALYRGLELSAVGRACAETIAALDADFSAQFRSVPFNFYDPDYSMLEARNRHVLVFSAHGIEQAPELSREVITGLFALGDNISGVHFEPVGWQIRAEKDMPAAQIGATEENAKRLRHNRNLLPLLRELEQEGLITVKSATPDVFGHNLKSVSSLIVWERTKKD